MTSQHILVKNQQGVVVIWLLVFLVLIGVSIILFMQFMDRQGQWQLLADNAALSGALMLQDDNNPNAANNACIVARRCLNQSLLPGDSISNFSCQVVAEAAALPPFAVQIQFEGDDINISSTAAGMPCTRTVRCGDARYAVVLR